MLRSLLLLTVLSLGVMACDETDPADETPDSERIVGQWDASSASLNIRNVPVPVRVADLASAEDEQTFTFQADGRFSFVFDPQDGRVLSFMAGNQTVRFPLDQTVRIAGTYEVNETTDQITFSTVAGQTQDDFRLGYGFNANALDLTAENSATLVRLFGLASEDAGRLAGFVDGGQITYQKAGA